MKTYQIEIKNPIALKILRNLANLDLIDISEREDKKNDFSKLLSKFRNTPGKTPTLDDITQEVETVRKKRYAKK